MGRACHREPTPGGRSLAEAAVNHFPCHYPLLVRKPPYLTAHQGWDRSQSVVLA